MWELRLIFCDIKSFTFQSFEPISESGSSVGRVPIGCEVKLGQRHLVKNIVVETNERNSKLVMRHKNSLRNKAIQDTHDKVLKILRKSRNFQYLGYISNRVQIKFLVQNLFLRELFWGWRLIRSKTLTLNTHAGGLSLWRPNFILTIIIQIRTFEKLFISSKTVIKYKYKTFLFV